VVQCGVHTVADTVADTVAECFNVLQSAAVCCSALHVLVMMMSTGVSRVYISIRIVVYVSVYTI